MLNDSSSNDDCMMAIHMTSVKLYIYYNLVEVSAAPNLSNL